ncbi:hypothetical protein ACFL7M_00355 [Thermodesulfobacteriota bacterium]
MAQITIRGIDPDIEEEIRKKALESGKSLNRVILDLLQKNADLKKRQLPKADSLKRLAGGWNKEDASQFIESMKIFEQIDKETWK